jgi:hypothetical protein
MSTTCKSPRKVALTALAVGKGALRPYSHRFSPKTFTQPQLFACLVLKVFFHTDYRGIEAILTDGTDLCKAIGLEKVPHFTTLQKASRRLLCRRMAEGLVAATLREGLGRRRRIKLAAIDSTGLETRHVSRYFVHRRSRAPNLWQSTTYTRFPKLGLVCDCRTHLVLSALTVRGPCPDVHQFRATLAGSIGRIRILWLLGDAGYDSEANHRYAREVLGIRTLIPPGNGRPSATRPTTRYRRLMSRRFPHRRYGQRWQAETVMSMIKRNLGSDLSARSYHAQNREMRLFVLVHNLTIVLCVIEVFYRA